MALEERALSYTDYGRPVILRNAGHSPSINLAGDLLVSDFAYAQGMPRDAVQGLRRVDTNVSPFREEILLGRFEGSVPVLLHTDCKDLVPISTAESNQCDLEIQSILNGLPADRWHEAFCNLDPRLAFFCYRIPDQPFRGNTASWRDIEIVDSYGMIFYPNSGYVGAEIADWIPQDLKDLDPELPGMRHFRRTKNAGAVRERKLLFSKLLTDRMLENAQNGDRTKILSLAAGSGRTNFYAISRAEEVHGLPHDHTSLHCIDMDPGAREYSLALAGARGFNIGSPLRYDIENVLRIPRVVKDPDYTDVNFEGLADYFDDKGKILLLNKVKPYTRTGGRILMSNVMPNSEAVPFLHQVVDWERMYYCDVPGLVSVARAAGFPDKDIKVHVIPSGMYGVLELTMSEEARLTAS